MALKIHSRYRMVGLAKGDLSELVCEWIKKHDELTYAEMMSCMVGVLSSWAGNWVRAEREEEEDDGQ